MDVATAARDVLKLGCMNGIAYYSCYELAKRVFPNRQDTAVAGDAIFGLVYYPLLVILAAAAVRDLHESTETRWTGVNAASVLLGKLLVSRMLVHVPYLYLKRTPEEIELRPMYILHHSIVIVSYGAGVLRRLSPSASNAQDDFREI